MIKPLSSVPAPAAARAAADRMRITDFRDIALLADRLASSMKVGLRQWHAIMPRHVVDRACELLIDEGYVGPQVHAVLDPYLASHPQQDDLIRTLADAAEAMAWERHRIAIAPDRDLWIDLGEVGDDDVLSADVFRYLPYETPFIQFPEPKVLSTGDPARLHQVVGAYLYGIRHDHDVFRGVTRQVMCSTADPRAFTLAFKFAGIVTDLDGVAQSQTSPSGDFLDMITTIVVLWFDKKIMTFAELTARSNNRFANKRSFDPLLLPVEDARTDATELVRRTLAFVMYLCCSNADLQVRKVTVSKAKKRRVASGKKEPVIVQAGFRVGAAIRQWRIERERGEAGPPTGRRNRPHPRRSHFHRFRIGKGRQQLSQPRWMRMLWVNWKGPADVTTVKPAKG